MHSESLFSTKETLDENWDKKSHCWDWNGNVESQCWGKHGTKKTFWVKLGTKKSHCWDWNENG